MKIFNARKATDEYMSTHSLTFSTPEMTLKKFALWLAEHVNDSTTNTEVPRLMLFMEEQKNQESDFMHSSPSDYLSTLPDIDETFKPTGAITDMYKDSNITSTSNNTVIKESICTTCGFSLKPNSKFCKNCGSKQ